MLTQINDIEKLPKMISKGIEYFELYMYITGGYSLCLTYDRRNHEGRKTLCGVVVQGNRIEINDDIDHVGNATTLEEAVNMLYEYVMNNPDIKIEE